jgi:hypothetical protein
MVVLILGCGGPSSPPGGNADVKTPGFGPSGETPVVSEAPKPSEDQKLADQAKAETMKKFAAEAVRWPAIQTTAADPKAGLAQTAAGNAEADRVLADTKAAAVKVSQQPPVDTSAVQHDALERASALIKLSAEKLGKDKKASDKSWQAPPATKPADATPAKADTAPPAPAPKPQPKAEKKSSSNKPAAKKPADKKPVDE